MLSVFAEFETSLRKERQMEGIKKAQKKGLFTERKKTINDEEIRLSRKKGLGATMIATEMGISRKSVYRALDSF